MITINMEKRKVSKKSLQHLSEVILGRDFIPSEKILRDSLESMQTFKLKKEIV